MAHFKAEDYDAALSRFQAAYEILPTPKLFLNIANALQKLGREPAAAEAFERFLQGAPPADEKRRIAEEELQALRKRLGRLRLDLPVSSPAAVVTLDRNVLKDPIGRTIYVSPGSHEIGVSAPGYVAKTERIALVAEEERRMTLSLEVAPRLVDWERTEARRAARMKKIWGIAVGGLGIALVGTGLYFGLEAQGKSEELLRCNPCGANRFQALQSEGERADLTAKVLLITGGTAVVSGALLYYFGFRQGRLEPGEVAIAPLPGGALITFEGRL